MTSPAVARTSESVRLLSKLIERSKRRTGIQLPPAFLRDDTHDSIPPMAKMLRGGRGGEVRLKLYLTMTLLAAGSPYDIKSLNGRRWAQILALPDPDCNGARRIGDALTWLETERLVTLERRPGMPPRVILRSPTGDGTKYHWRGNRYISLPLEFWQQEWIYHLSPTAVALLLVIRDLQGGRSPDDPPWLPGDERRRYGLSDDTWTRARKELEKHELLTVRRVPQGDDFDYRRLRNTYWLNLERMAKPVGGDGLLPE